MFTIKEIAERANVSRTTVSRVINSSGYVSEDAKKRVLQVIDETGYVPSENAKSLRTKKTKVIGVILPKISTETSSRLVNGIDDILAKKGYQIILANSNLELEKEIEYLRLLKSRHVDGIILSATNINPILVKEIEQLNIPFVTVGQLITGFDNVVFDDYQASKDMAQLLINKGYQKIAFIGVDEQDHAVGYLRKLGYVDALKDNNLSVEKGWIEKGIFDVNSGYEAMNAILNSSVNKPDAVLCVTDRLAIGAMQYAQEIGWTIPDELAIVGMGASELSQFITPSLSTIDYLVDEAGRAAASLLLGRIEGENEQVTVKTIPHRFIERNSI